MRLIIIGAGGFGREVFQWATDQYSAEAIKGFLSPNASDLDGFRIDKPILGTEDTYEFQSEDRFILAVGSPKIRKNISDKILSRGGKFINLIHPTAVVSQLATIGEGVIICPFALVSPNANIEDFSVLNFYCSVAHDATLGKYSVMSPYSTLNGNSQTFEGVFLGTGVSLAPRVEIGAWSKISAGLAVVSSVGDNTLAPPNKIKIMRGLL
ncbi:MAG: hypothetical protein K2Q26_14245 [Bdellovibrionales bacterium]|nr:hypothetical protein [Bdellovibrionales bacterium]